MKSLWKYLFLFMATFAVVVSTNGQTIIQMEKEGGVYKIPCEINGLRLKLIFDTGASNVCISESIALMMLENGYLDKADIRGNGSSVVADGRIVDNTKINVRTLKIGNVTLNNVEAIVIHKQSAPLLLGQSAIQKLGKISISEDKLILNSDTTTHISTSHAADGGNVDYQSILAKAQEACNGELYELAASYYDKCYNYTCFDNTTKWHYAYCLFQSGKYDRALAVYNDINIDSLSLKRKIAQLSFMARCYFYIGDYNSSIVVGQNALLQCMFNKELLVPYRAGIISYIKDAYIKKEGIHKAKQFIQDEIYKYLRNENMSATDCWDIGCKDSYVGRLYFLLASSIAEYEKNLSEVNKYIKIAAAWGDDYAIRNCNKYSLSYKRKPYDAEYTY